MLVSGIDIGTTNLKVALFGAGGRCLWLRNRPSPRTRDDALGPATDATALVEEVESLIVEGWVAIGRPGPIRAIATAGVGEDGVYVDADMVPLAPAIPWFDQRAVREAEELRASPSATPRAGIAMDPTRTAPKWLWSARHRPDMVRKSAHWLALTDYPLARWAGTPFISDTLASRTGCFDPVAREWIAPLLAESRAPRLPQVLRAGTVVDVMRDGALLSSGAADGRTLLVAGGHDHPVAAHAIHRLSPLARIDSMGTANVIYGEADSFAPASFDPLIAFMASIDGPSRLACLGVFEFTAAVNAFPGGMAAVRAVLDLPRMAGAPALVSGPPFADARGLLEWASVHARLMLDRLGDCGVPDGPIFATGGWSRSRALLELRASIYNAPVHAPEEKELSVLGAALIATAALGQEASFPTDIAVVEPRPEWVDVYGDLVARFGNLTGR